MKTTIVDFSTVLGITIAFGLIITAINIGGNPGGFIDSRSILIVVLGTLSVTIASFSFSEVFSSIGHITKTVFYHFENPQKSAIRSLELAELSRKQGILSLDKERSKFKHNPILFKGLELLIDGMPPEKVTQIIEQDINSSNARHHKGIEVLQKAAEISPAMGLIGTLIGLVQMLGNLEDPSTIGPSMAVALLTTFYGAGLAYLVFIPVASKLERISQRQLMTAEIYLSTIKFIANRENPRQLEIILNTLLPPSKQVHYFK